MLGIVQQTRVLAVLRCMRMRMLIFVAGMFMDVWNASSEALQCQRCACAAILRRAGLRAHL